MGGVEYGSCTVSSCSRIAAFGRRLVALLAGVTLLSTAVPSGASTAHHLTPALMSVGTWNAGSTYRLTTPNSCTVGDGNLAFTNPSAAPIQITGIDLRTKADASMTVATDLIAERPGSTTGEVAASSTLSVLAGGRVLGKAVGAVVPPYRTHAAWYFLASRVHLHSPITYPWEIDGLEVHYRSPSGIGTLILSQQLFLAAAPHCR
jgi:hypothetical protein